MEDAINIIKVEPVTNPSSPSMKFIKFIMEVPIIINNE